MYANGMLKVPLECANLEFRNFQKQLDKDIGGVVQFVQDLCQKLREKNSSTDNDANSQVNWQKVVENLKKCEAKLRGTEQKVQDNSLKMSSLFQKCKARTEFILEHDNKKEVMYLIVDHLLRRGYHETAKLLADEYGLNELVDTVVFQNIYRISLELRQGNIEPALKWCAERRSKLRKMNSSLEFELRRLEFLLMVSKGTFEEAVYYAQKHLAPFHKDQFEAIKKAMATLALSSRDKSDPVWNKSAKRKNSHGSTQIMRDGEMSMEDSDEEEATENTSSDFDSEDRLRRLKRKRVLNFDFDGFNKAVLSKQTWLRVVEQFERESNAMLSLSQQSLLQMCLQVGLSALKTHQCSPNKLRKVGPRAYNCPCCDPLFSRFAEDLPFAQHVQSQLVCRISGEVMNENNPPIALPNGQVYSQKALDDLIAKSSNGLGTCPVTKQTFSRNDFTKVFVL